MRRKDPWKTRGSEPLLTRTMLWACDRLRRPLVAAGVDVRILRELLRVRLLRYVRGNGGSFGVPVLAAITLSFSALAFFLTGALSSIVLLMGEGVDIWLGASQGLFMTMIAFVIFTQYVSTLVDATDIEVLSGHPVP
ncbi:MAG TPA: hypothetical protein ENJ09_04360, partial [Planctomycetes bacterium]|nr:hypothetical protein [Planctomycetota bacterium]